MLLKGISSACQYFPLHKRWYRCNQVIKHFYPEAMICEPKSTPFSCSDWIQCLTAVVRWFPKSRSCFVSRITRTFNACCQILKMGAVSSTKSGSLLKIHSQKQKRVFNELLSINKVIMLEHNTKSWLLLAKVIVHRRVLVLMSKEFIVAKNCVLVSKLSNLIL